MSINDEFWKRQTGHAPAESNMAQNIALLQATARAEARNQALEEAAKLADERGAATTATASRAMIAPSGEG